MENGTLIAALDLGSNSFRLEIGRFENGHIRRTEYLKETVRQGNGLDGDRNLTPEALQRGWDCLARFAERLSGFQPYQVRAVATQTLREARNRDVFLTRAHEILGFPIEVIPGREEARLIYQGVAHLLAQSDERRLVVDIGGRSTELILGQAYDAQVVGSFRLGSVAWSMSYFPQGQFTVDAFRVAGVAARAVLDEAVHAYRRDAWDIAYGSSGTVGAVSDVLAAEGWPVGLINRKGLDWLIERLLKAQNVDKLRLEGVKDDRKLVIGGGVSVLRAVFDVLDIDEMHSADGALRHGVLYDLLQRDHKDTDLRSSSVQELARKFCVDEQQALRVRLVAVSIFQQLCKYPALSASEESRHLRKLGWAAQLHEIGCHISESSHHRHGAYLLDNVDAPGFAMPELHKLSQLVLGQRGKLRKLDIDFTDLFFVYQLISLRLAVLLCHARRDPDMAGIEVMCSQAKPQTVALKLKAGWAQQFPQSAFLLREELLARQKTMWSLEIDEA
jgi:exopolyphosphatase/guanosine-5'-triphosphate,3'-diphosphate pyrophosphatase